MTASDLAACHASARKLARRTGCDWRDLLGYAAIRVLELRRDVPLVDIGWIRKAAAWGARDGIHAMHFRGACAWDETLAARPATTEWEVGLREVLRRMPPLAALAALEAADGADGAETGAACRRSRITGWRVNARALAIAKGAAGACERTEGMQVEMWEGRSGY